MILYHISNKNLFVSDLKLYDPANNWESHNKLGKQIFFTTEECLPVWKNILEKKGKTIINKYVINNDFIELLNVYKELYQHVLSKRYEIGEEESKAFYELCKIDNLYLRWSHDDQWLEISILDEKWLKYFYD